MGIHLDFPAAPANGDKYPVTPIAGQPQYTWDGEKWTTVGAQITNAAPASALPLMNATPAVVGTTTKYAREDHIHPTDSTLLAKSANLADVADVTTSRKSIYAAPFDALAYSGMQINGSFEVSQELGVTTIAPPSGTPKYIADGWVAAFIGTGGPQAGQLAITSLPGFPYCIYFACSTTNPLAGSNDGQWFYQAIEGYRWSRLGWGTASAQPVTVGFWVIADVAGTMAVSVRGGGGAGRSYIVDVPVTTGWQFKTVTIPGDVAGTWINNNGIGSAISFCFGAGSSRKAASANTWVTGDLVASPATTNFFATANVHVYLTGVVVLPGIEAPSATRSPLIMRPYDQELLTCRRYFNKMVFPVNCSIATLMAYSTTAAYGPIATFAEMRSSPTFGLSSGFNLQGPGTGGIPITVTGNVSSTTGAYAAPFNTAGSLNSGNAVNLIASPNSYFTFDARL